VARLLLVAGMVLLALVVNPVVPAVVAVNVRPFRVEGESMAPRHSGGDFLLITTRDESPARGDIAVVRHPAEAGGDLIKRIIALPGETIEITRGVVFVDGERLGEPYVTEPWSGTLRPVTLREGDYFVMGDNRNHSTDSRAFGPVTWSDFVGREFVAYWPVSRNGGGFALLGGVLLAWVAAAILAIAATVAVATRRGRSGWWCIPAWVLGGIGLLGVYLLLDRKDDATSEPPSEQEAADSQ